MLNTKCTTATPEAASPETDRIPLGSPPEAKPKPPEPHPEREVAHYYWFKEGLLAQAMGMDETLSMCGQEWSSLDDLSNDPGKVGIQAQDCRWCVARYTARLAEVLGR